MGRLPKTGIHAKKNQSCFDVRKRHRDADCKYRSKVQYLYFKIKSLLRKKTAKEGLLDNALGFIQNLESEIYEKSGPDLMEDCKKEFFNFLVQEESLWKKEKDVTKWWTKVEDLLSKDYPLNLRVHKEMASAVEEDSQHCKFAKHPCQKKSLIPSKNLNKNGTSRVDEHMAILSSYNEEEFLNVCVDTAVRNKDDFSSSVWNAPSNFRSFASNNNKGKDVFEEALSDDSASSNSNDIFNTSVPLDASYVPVPVDNSMVNTLEYSQQARSSFLYL